MIRLTEIEKKGLLEWQYNCAMEASLENAIENRDWKFAYFLIMNFDRLFDLYFDRLPDSVFEDEEYNEYWQQWDDYMAAELSGGKFSRVRVQKRYQAKGYVGWRTAEDRDLNKPRLRLIKKTSERLEARELEEMDVLIDTTPRVGGTRTWTFGSEKPVIRLNRTKVTPFPRSAEVEVPEFSIRTKSQNDDKYDRRLRGSAPGTSKSSPFSNIS